MKGAGSQSSAALVGRMHQRAHAHRWARMHGTQGPVYRAPLCHAVCLAAAKPCRAPQEEPAPRALRRLPSAARYLLSQEQACVLQHSCRHRAARARAAGCRLRGAALKRRHRAPRAQRQPARRSAQKSAKMRSASASSAGETAGGAAAACVASSSALRLAKSLSCGTRGGCSRRAASASQSKPANHCRGRGCACK